MNNKSIGYWDGYLSKEAEDSTGGWEESLAELNKVEELNVEQAAEQRKTLQKQLEDDFFYGVTADESKRKFGAAGAGAGLGAILGGLMGGTRGAAVGGILGSLLGFVGQAMGLIPEDTWEWLMKWREEGKMGGEVKKLWGKRKARLAAEAEGGAKGTATNKAIPVGAVGAVVGGGGDVDTDPNIETIANGDNGNAVTNGINANARAAAAVGTSDEAQAQADLKQATDVANEAGVGESVKTHAAKFTVSNQTVTGTTQGTHTMPGDPKATAVAATTPEPAVSPEKRFGAKYDPQQGWLDSRLTEEDFRSIAKHEGADAARSSAMSNVGYWGQVANENESFRGTINPAQTRVPRSVVDNPIRGMSAELRGKLKERYTWQQMNLPFKGVAAVGTPEREAYNVGLQKKLDQHWTSLGDASTGGAVKPFQPSVAGAAGTGVPAAVSAGTGQTASEDPMTRMRADFPKFESALKNDRFRKGWDPQFAERESERREEQRALAGKPLEQPAEQPPDPPENQVKYVTGPTHDSRGNKMIQEITPHGVFSRPKVTPEHRTPETPKVQTPKTKPPKTKPPKTKLIVDKKTRVRPSGFSGGGRLWNTKLGASEVLSMPWYAAQKLAGPGQIQQVPVEPAQQAPTEKDVFDQEAKEVDHKAKMEDYKMQMGLIGAKTQAGQAAADQATQTSQAKATEAAQPAAGTGQYTAGANPSTVGANPSTVGANPSTVGANPSTVGANPSTVGTEPTAMAGSMSMNQPMPEAQWKAPTTV